MYKAKIICIRCTLPLAVCLCHEFPPSPWWSVFVEPDCGTASEVIYKEEAQTEEEEEC